MNKITKSKKILSVVLTLLLIVSYLPVTAVPARAAVVTADYDWYSNPVGDEYFIGTAAELLGFANIVNAADGQTRNLFSGKTIKLTADIDLSEVCNAEVGSWIQIGDSSTNAFKGTFDGEGYEIQNIYIQTTTANQGLFGYSKGVIKNLGISGTITSGFNLIGGIAGINSGVITNCYNACSIQGKYNVGGITGMNKGDISNCYNMGAITTINDGVTGGIAGVNSEGKVSNCYNTGVITSTSSMAKYMGGIVGQGAGGEIKNCYNTGDVYGEKYVGGILGARYNINGIPACTVSECVSLGLTIAGTGGVEVGRIVGKYDTDAYSDNKAREDISLVINGNVASAQNKGTDAIDGVDIVLNGETTMADVFDGTWSSEIWDFEGTDIVEVGVSLPTLKTISSIQNVALLSAPIYSISLDLATDYTFPSAVTGYGEQTALDITVTNTGNRAIGELNITLSGANESCFTLSSSTISSLDTDGVSGFSVRPNTGLPNGTYTEIVKVSGSNGISETFNVSFTVTKAADPTPSTTPTETKESEPDQIVTSNIDMVRLTPSSATVIQGKTKSFTATVVGTEDSSKEVSWSVEGNTSSNTVISTDGVLTVGKDEGATTLIVKATSKGDNTKSAQVTVKVVAKKGTKFTVGNYTYIIADDKFNGTGTVTLTGVAKGKTVTTVNVSETVKYKGVEYDVTAIGEKAFYQNKDIKKATIGNNVTVIGKNSFRECTSLTEVIVGDSVTVISYGAFYKCTTLKKITIGTGLQEIGNHAFCHDKALETMIIESTKLTKLGDHVLYANMKLTIKVPSSKVSAYEKLFTKTVQGKKVVVLKK